MIHIHIDMRFRKLLIMAALTVAVLCMSFVLYSGVYFMEAKQKELQIEILGFEPEPENLAASTYSHRMAVIKRKISYCRVHPDICKKDLVDLERLRKAMRNSKKKNDLYPLAIYPMVRNVPGMYVVPTSLDDIESDVEKKSDTAVDQATHSHRDNYINHINRINDANTVNHINYINRGNRVNRVSKSNRVNRVSKSNRVDHVDH